MNSTTLALMGAVVRQTLVVTEAVSRFGEPVFYLSDDYGLVEVALSRDEADARVVEVTALVEKSRRS